MLRIKTKMVARAGTAPTSRAPVARMLLLHQLRDGYGALTRTEECWNQNPVR